MGIQFAARHPQRSGIRAFAGILLLCAAVLGPHAAPADAAPKFRKATIPNANLTKNPTFMRSVKGWQGIDARVHRVRDRTAPNGRTAAKVRAHGTGPYWLNGSPAKLRGGSRAGARYTGSAWVRGNARGVGRRVMLVVRETTQAGELIQDSHRTIKLRRGYRKVRATLFAKRDGSVIDLYLSRPEGSVVPGEGFFADAVTVTAENEGRSPRPPAEGSHSTVAQIAIINTHEELIKHEQGSRYRYLVVRDGMHRYVDDLREANPRSEILLYKDLSFTIKDEVPGCLNAPFEVTGVSFCAAEAHESWFLHDAAGGQRLTSDAYPNLYAMDVADPGYRQAWLNAVRSRLLDAEGDRSGVRWDGVYIDDTNLYPGHGMDGRIRELSDDAYLDATIDFIAHVSPALQADGFTTMANVGMDMYDPKQRAASKELARHLDVYNREYFMRWSNRQVFTTPHANRGNDWIDELTHMEEIQRTGAKYTAVVYGDDGETEVQRYARATFLLGWDGRDGSALIYRASGASDGYLPDVTTDVGVPTGERYAVGEGWRRDFSAGTVLVNPHPSRGQSFDLDGSFRLPSGECRSSIELRPASALVLPGC